ncbi:MAG: cupredoxin family copper-binding protein [Stellaceae bacterium]
MPTQPASHITAVRLATAAALVVAAAGAIAWLSSTAHSIGPAMAHHGMGEAAMSHAMEEVAVAANEVVIDNFAFEPKTLTVAAGTDVVWINQDDEPHTVVYSGDAKLFKSPALDTSDKFSFVFKEPGTYSYYCSVHPHMTGTIIVR